MAGGMSRFFDSLMDTKDKRYHGTLILMLAVFGSIAITYIILGVSLCMVKDYDNVFSQIGIGGYVDAISYFWKYRDQYASLHRLVGICCSLFRCDMLSYFGKA